MLVGQKQGRGAVARSWGHTAGAMQHAQPPEQTVVPNWSLRVEAPLGMSPLSSLEWSEGGQEGKLRNGVLSKEVTLVLTERSWPQGWSSQLPPPLAPLRVGRSYFPVVKQDSSCLP